VSTAIVEPGASPSGQGYAAQDRRLASNSLRFLGGVAISVGIQGPTGGILFIPALMAGIVGSQGPFAFFIAMLAMLPIAYVFGAFSREYASAGSAYAFAGSALKPLVGFAACFSLLIVYITYTSANYTSTTNIFEALLHDQGLPHIPWPLVALVFFGLSWYLAYRTIHFSALLIFALEGISLLIVLVVGIVVIAKGGYHGHGLHLQPLTRHGLPFQTAMLGLVFAYTGFSGFEGAASTGEETKLPRRNIPAAIFASLLIGGGFYTFGSFIETIGFPNAAALGKSEAPLQVVSAAFVAPWVGTLILVASVVSAFGAILACHNAAARLLFALGRDGFISDKLARTHPVQRSPHIAVGAVAVLSALGVVGLIDKQPLDIFFDQATVGADMILCVYLIVCIAGVALAVRRRKPLLAIVSVVGIAVLALVIRYTVYPIAQYPFNRLQIIAGALVLLGFAIPLLIPGFHRRVKASPLFTGELATAGDAGEGPETPLPAATRG